MDNSSLSLWMLFFLTVPPIFILNIILEIFHGITGYFILSTLFTDIVCITLFLLLSVMLYLVYFTNALVPYLPRSSGTGMGGLAILLLILIPMPFLIVMIVTRHLAAYLLWLNKQY